MHAAHRAGRLAIAVAATVTCTSAIPARAAETSFDADIDAAYDTNVTRAQLRDDIRADGYVAANGSAMLRWPLEDADAVSVGAGLRAAQYARFTRLSHAAAEASAAWQRKLGLGLSAPWIAASVLAAYESYRETVRDSDRIEARVSAGRRFSEHFDGSFGYAYDRRYARHDDVLVPGISGAVWDIAGHTGYARLGYVPTESWLIDAGYAYRRGDVVSTTHRNRAIFLAADAIGKSDAFGAGFFDYRLRGTTQTGTASASYALGTSASVNVTYAYGFTRAAQGLEYQGNVFTAAWLYRY